MMKKISSLFLIVSLLFALAGCSTSPASTESSLPVTSATQQEESSATQDQTGNETADVEMESPTSDSETDQEEPVENTILVAYFSATGTTEQVAQQAAEILGADIYEIVPEEPYTEADLAYYTGGRADQEQDDPNARPAIAGGIEDMSQYDTVLLGYPIWLAYHKLIQCTQIA